MHLLHCGGPALLEFRSFELHNYANVPGEFHSVCIQYARIAGHALRIEQPCVRNFMLKAKS